jgi:hypothetical protein
MHENRGISIGVVIAVTFGLLVTVSAAFAQLKIGADVPPQQYVMIKSNTHWEGSILDSSHDNTVIGNYGDAKFDINCNDGAGPFSVVFNKQGGFGNLTASLMKNEKVLDTQSTTDSFGGIQISGNCEIAY